MVNGMSDAFRAIVRWISVILIGAALGGAVSMLGAGGFVTAIGSVLLLACGVFVGATIWATYIPFIAHPARPAEPEDAQDHADLRGPALFRAVTIGFFGAGFCVGGLTAVGGYLVVSGTAGLIALLLTLEPRRSTRR
jgi:hypothetical protein